MWVFDSLTGAIVAANDAAVRAYGYSLGELLGRKMTDLCVVDASGGVALPNHADGDASWTGTSTQRRKDGSTFTAELGMIETKEATRVATMVIVHPWDAQNGTHAAHAAEGAARGGRPGPSLETASRASFGCARTHSRILPPRGEADEGREAPVDAHVAIDPLVVVRSARDRVRARAEAKDVDIVIHCACRRAWAHPRSFAEALYALLDNAVRAARRGHPVVVDVRDTGEGDIVWQIQDAGVGMSERELSELGQGAGRGVPQAWRAIEAHGGLLRFESAVGVGTTASIWLPAEGSSVVADDALQR